MNATTNTLSHRSVLATLTLSSWGVRKGDDEATDETLQRKGATKASGLFTKRLLNKGAMKDIRTLKHKARKYHKRKTSPWLDDGTRILPTVFLREYMDEMAKFRKEYEQAVAKFLHEYPKHKLQAKKELGGLFREEDYPSPEEIKSKFGFEVVMLPYPDTQDFRADMDATDLAEIKGDLEKRLQEQVKTITKDIAARLAEVVGHMAARLKEYKPGNAAKGIKATNTFRDTLVTNVQDLAKLIEGLNMTGDAKIEAIRKKVVKELCMAKPDDLRDDEKVRKKVLASATQIAKEVSAFM